MANEAGKRRLNVIAAHFSPTDDGSAAHLQPLNCSTYFSSVTRRGDNKVYFARQGSDSQAAYMRQASIAEGKSSTRASDGPSFARPGSEPLIQSVGMEQPVAQDFNLTATEPPRFAKPSCGFSDDQQNQTKLPSSGSNGIGWSPRMDVAESGRSFVLTVEIPGVKISDIRVEVDDRKLSVTGKRLSQCYEMGGHVHDPISSYHKREILEGPYQVVWPLPINIDKDRVVADFWDGLLRIVVPKL